VAIFPSADHRARKPNRIRVRPRPGRPSLGHLTLGNLVLPCALGRAGLTRFKREGDGATPVGRFALLGGYRRADRALPPAGPLGLVALRPDDGWCDDVDDGRYNRPVRRPFAGSHEALWRDDRLYDLVIVLDANVHRRIIGRGSAIFFHLAQPNFEPTAGCVALRPTDMRRLLAHLGHDPVMIIG
jgi:L,D-peptidoglycan transpeptidase YkuD (ErfK/YbiS/YcfS/YnhG family)